MNVDVVVAVDGSEAYRKAHARDGINEMHPEILNRRISTQETGEMAASRVRKRDAQREGGKGVRKAAEEKGKDRQGASETHTNRVKKNRRAKMAPFQTTFSWFGHPPLSGFSLSRAQLQSLPRDAQLFCSNFATSRLPSWPRHRRRHRHQRRPRASRRRQRTAASLRFPPPWKACCSDPGGRAAAVAAVAAVALGRARRRRRRFSEKGRRRGRIMTTHRRLRSRGEFGDSSLST